jgi:hypothetical protein
MMTTKAGDVIEWLALRHVSGGSIALYGEVWLDGGLRPIGLPFDAIRESGALVLDGPDPVACGMRRATLTPAGWARFAALDEQHGHRSVIPNPGRECHGQTRNSADAEQGRAAAQPADTAPARAE